METTYICLHIFRKVQFSGERIHSFYEILKRFYLIQDWVTNVGEKKDISLPAKLYLSSQIIINGRFVLSKSSKSENWYLSLHSFIQQIFMEHLLCARDTGPGTKQSKYPSSQGAYKYTDKCINIIDIISSPDKWLKERERRERRVNQFQNGLLFALYVYLNPNKPWVLSIS